MGFGGGLLDIIRDFQRAWDRTIGRKGPPNGRNLTLQLVSEVTAKYGEEGDMSSSMAVEYRNHLPMLFPAPECHALYCRKMSIYRVYGALQHRFDRPMVSHRNLSGLRWLSNSIAINLNSIALCARPPGLG
jgi:hypothetical protein